MDLHSTLQHDDLSRRTRNCTHTHTAYICSPKALLEGLVWCASGVTGGAQRHVVSKPARCLSLPWPVADLSQRQILSPPTPACSSSLPAHPCLPLPRICMYTHTTHPGHEPTCHGRDVPVSCATAATATCYGGDWLLPASCQTASHSNINNNTCLPALADGTLPVCTLHFAQLWLLVIASLPRPY